MRFLLLVSMSVVSVVAVADDVVVTEVEFLKGDGLVMMDAQDSGWRN
jgi:hypothetical protein